MPKQAEMFGDPYAPFEQGLPEDYPKHAFKPLHRVFSRKGHVVSGTTVRRKYYIDLAIGECECERGYAWGLKQKIPANPRASFNPWFEGAYCGHKLRMMSMIVKELQEADHDKEELREIAQAYLKALGTRYNPFEAVSAFHKELRRGDFKEAWFWGLILTTKRGMRGVFQYMLNIIYEETRDHDLADYLLKCRTSQRMQTLASVSKAISWFCATPKKWELPRRYAIFESEMHGYRQLVKDYGRDVAKGANIIPKDNRDRLLLHMQKGAEDNDLVRFQRGLKGLQKLQYLDHPDPSLTKFDRDGERNQEYRYWLYGELYDLADRLCPPQHDVWRVIQFVNARIEAGQGIGYHELNAIGDAITGEPADAGLLPPDLLKRAQARPTPAIPLFKWPLIPLYAHDNHTHGGKRLMNKFPDQLKPGAEQTDLDFRYCGAYFGVAYRMVSQKQHGRVADWHEVKWPTDLYNIVMSLWY